MTSPTRRAVLGLGLAGGVAAVAGCSSDDSGPAPASTTATTSTAAPTAEPSAAPVLDPQDWDSVRAQFLLDPSMAQFAAFVLSPHTHQLEAAIAAHREALGTDTEAALNASYQYDEDTRAVAASYAGGSAGQYALTTSTTMGVATMYGGLTLQPGDEVLTTTHDFVVTERALDVLAQRQGVRVRRVKLYDDPAGATVDTMVTRLMAGLTGRTRVVAITWVHSSTGVRTPVREITDALAGRGILLCVDGVHGFNAVDVDLPDLGCDILASGTHKWLFGPRGTGILWARDWKPFTELIPSFSGDRQGRRLSPGGYQAFEHTWAMRDAFTLMASIGRTRVVERTVSQATRLKEGLAEVPGIRLVTPLDPAVSAGIVCVDVRGMLPANAVADLRMAGVVASATPYVTSYLRLGPSIATTPEQVDQAIEAVTALV